MISFFLYKILGLVIRLIIVKFFGDLYFYLFKFIGEVRFIIVLIEEE